MKEISRDQPGLAEKWLSEIQLAEKWADKWSRRAESILKRYKDERDDTYNMYGPSSNMKYNIFWSNVQTLQSAIYTSPPKTIIERRFKDADPLGRVACQVLERGTDFAITNYDFDSVLRAARDDFLIVGRGTAWVRYKPTYDSTSRYPIVQSQTGQLTQPNGAPVPTNTQVQQDSEGYYFTGPEYEVLAFEEVVSDYVYWGDFIHSPARKWEDVRWVGRKVYMSPDETKERFGEEIASQISMNYLPQNIADDKSLGDNRNELYKKACIYEIWDKDTKKVYWVSKGSGKQLLDVKDDFLGLKNFFPCPKPLYATLTTDSLIPIPDFAMYQDQANQLDLISSRLTCLTEALKVAGLYDAECDEIKRLLQEGNDNTLIPVARWATLQQKGGFEGVVTFMPLGEIVTTLSQLTQIKAQIENDIYQITGISDIIRGYSAASETATAQQIKGQFATIRLKDRQRAIAKFAKELIGITAEIIAEHFDENTLAVMAGVENLSAEAQQSFGQAVELLRNDLLRSFRVDIETDAMIQIDEQSDKESRIEFLQAVGDFMQRSLPLAQQIPAFADVIGQMLMFNVRGFHAGRNLESSLEAAISATQQQAKAQMEASQQPQEQQPAPPDPALVKIQQDGQLKQAELQIEGAKLEIERLLAQVKEREVAIKEREQQFKEAQAQLDFSLKEQEIQAKVGIEQQKIQAEIVRSSNEQSKNNVPMSPPNVYVDSSEVKQKVITMGPVKPDGSRDVIIKSVSPEEQMHEQMEAMMPKMGMPEAPEQTGMEGEEPAGD